MAYVKLQNNVHKEISRDQGRALWDVLTGKNEQPTPEQEAFANQVERLYLNWRNAPDDYLLKYKALVTPMVQASWLVDMRGFPMRPDPTDKDCVRVTRLLGLQTSNGNYANPFPAKR